MTDLTDPKTLREQAGHAAWEYHNPRRDLAFSEIMPEPLDWDAWCRQRAEAEAAALSRVDVHSGDTGCAQGQAAVR